ncbi:DsrE family protein [Stakelama saccharophila]|uniref:DsrE family protein n=1 Tax=Stakelama saccharophila TaxID=3075605 RepID=A0ABZ0B6J3_9SPHN|nr:DsrE family protein [Stakelama sp. W311]WNO53009.1 DsrE family protein [Stakelama sp. W311]
MRGLTIIVATGDADRFDAALAIASAHAALGARTRLYAHKDAVPLLHKHAPAARLEAVRTARETGVTIMACQSGLASHDLGVADLVEAVEPGGLIQLLSELGEDRLTIA